MLLLLAGLFALKITISSSLGSVTACKQHFVNAEDGHKICVWEKGPMDSPHSLILVHGRSFSAKPVYDLVYSSSSEDTINETSNLSVMDSLAECNVRSFAVDLRGFGGTERDKSGFLSPYRAVEDLKCVSEWIEKLGAPKPSVLGWSQGGLVAHLLCQKYPDSMRSIILYASIYDSSRIYPRQPFFSKPSEAPRRLTTAEATLEDFTLPGSISDEAAYAFSAAALASDRVKPDWTDLHEFNDIAPFRLTIPTLVIHGGNDPYLPPGAQINLFSGLSATDKSYVVIPYADHCAHLISSRYAFIHHVSSFLKRPTANDAVGGGGR
jgi:pimeloyl-ACP methyl ester carboxylesterase